MTLNIFTEGICPKQLWNAFAMQIILCKFFSSLLYWLQLSNSLMLKSCKYIFIIFHFRHRGLALFTHMPAFEWRAVTQKDIKQETDLSTAPCSFVPPLVSAPQGPACSTGSGPWPFSTCGPCSLCPLDTPATQQHTAIQQPVLPIPSIPLCSHKQGTAGHLHG